MNTEKLLDGESGAEREVIPHVAMHNEERRAVLGWKAAIALHVLVFWIRVTGN
jgi:hypothetical protein